MEEVTENRLLSEEIKWGIVIGYKYYNQSYSELQETFQMKSKGTITKILEKYKLQGNIDSNFQFSGREERISEVPQVILEEILQNQDEKKYNINDLKVAHNKELDILDISQSSTYRIMQKLGLKYGKARIVHQLTDANKNARRLYSKNQSFQILDNILFSDESIFSIKDSKIDVWYSDQSERNLENKELQYSEQQVHVWGGVSKCGKTALYIYDKTVNSLEYQKCLKQAFIPFWEENCKHIILLQDGAKAHTSNSTREFFKNENIQFIQNPAWSPDLNAIEYIWASMKKKFNKMKTNQPIKSKQQLITVVNELWEQVSQEIINQCIDHVQSNLEQVFLKNGNY